MAINPLIPKGSLGELIANQTPAQSIPSTTPFADKVKAVNNLATSIKTNAPVIQKAPVLPAPVLSYGQKPPSKDSISVDNPFTPTIIQTEQFARPDAGSSAISSIASKINNITVPENAPSSLVPPGYLTDQSGQMNWENVYEKLIEATQNNSFSQEEKLEETYKSWGIQESFELLKGITGQSLSVKSELDKLNNQEQTEISNLGGSGGMTTGTANSEYQRIQRDYEKRKAPLVATLAGFQAQAQMLQGNIQLARTYADDIINASTYDYESRAKQIASVGVYYKDVLENMKEQDELIYNTAKENAKNLYEQQKAERTQIVKWATDSTTAPALYNQDLGGIDFDKATVLVRNYLTMHSIKNKETKAPTDSQKVQTINNFLNSKKGDDGKISWETYAESAQKWIGLGGSTASFKTAFPPETLMNQGNVDALPSSLKPSSNYGFYGLNIPAPIPND